MIVCDDVIMRSISYADVVMKPMSCDEMMKPMSYDDVIMRPVILYAN